MNFRVGQKVVCVDGFWRAPSSNLSYPKEGNTYTLRDVFRPCCERVQADHPVCVRLEEIRQGEMAPERCEYCGVLSEMEFDSRRFRPLVEKKTDISIFTEMLNPKQRERVSP